MTTGIYIIFNNINDKVYIGKSLNIEDRWDRHKNDLKNGAHHSYKLQEDFNNRITLNIEVLDTNVTSEELGRLEVAYIKEFNSYYTGYNCTTGEGTTGTGVEHPKAIYDKEIYKKIVNELAYTNNPIKDIAAALGVSTNIVTNISLLRRHSWIKQEMPIEYEVLLIKRDQITKPRGTPEHVEKIFLDIVNTNMSVKEISTKYSVSIKIVEHIKYKETGVWLKSKYPKEYAILDIKVKRYAK